MGLLLASDAHGLFGGGGRSAPPPPAAPLSNPPGSSIDTAAHAAAAAAGTDTGAEKTGNLSSLGQRTNLGG